MCPSIDPTEATEPQQKCGSIKLAVFVLGDKWTCLIVQALTGGVQRFTELENGLGIGPRTLSQRLEFLVEREIIIKTQYAEAPPRVEYNLTQKGEDLLPVLQSMATWAAKYDV
jgi:DNA-binding HxlR family transcriptional regulator